MLHLCAFCFFKWVDNLNLVISLCDSAELITCSRTSYILRASRDFRKSGLCSSWELQRKLCFFLNLVVSYLSTCKKPIRFPNLQPFNLHHGIQMSFLGVTTQQLEQQVSPFHWLHRLFPETEKANTYRNSPPPLSRPAPCALKSKLPSAKMMSQNITNRCEKVNAERKIPSQHKAKALLLNLRITDGHNLWVKHHLIHVLHLSGTPFRWNPLTPQWNDLEAKFDANNMCPSPLSLSVSCPENLAVKLHRPCLRQAFASHAPTHHPWDHERPGWNNEYNKQLTRTSSSSGMLENPFISFIQQPKRNEESQVASRWE